MGEDVPTLQRAADQLLWVKGKISNGDALIIAAVILEKKKTLVGNKWLSTF